MNDFTTDRKNQILSLRSKIGNMRSMYATATRKSGDRERETIQTAIRTIVAWLKGEETRQRHSIRDYMIGFDDFTEAADGARHVEQLERYISDIFMARDDIVQYQGVETRDIAMSASNKLSIEALESTISSRLELIAEITKSLEEEVYDGTR